MKSHSVAIFCFLALAILCFQPAKEQLGPIQYEQSYPPQYGYFGLNNSTVLVGANLLYQQGMITPDEFNANTSVNHSMFAKTFDFPLNDQFSQQKLQQFVSQSLIAGAYPVITFVLAEGNNFTEMDITTLTNDISWVTDVLRDFSNYTIFINFFPDSNGNWYEWGQNPFKFIAAYQLFSQTIKSQFQNVQMIQTFTQDNGYPNFGGTPSPFLNDSEVGVYLDSNFDGVINGLDDPYTPYWAGGPNDDLVDWVGLEYSFNGVDQRNGTEFLDIVPADNQFDVGVRRFYNLVAKNHRLPTILTLNSAFYSPKPAGGNSSDLAIKSAWIDQTYNIQKLQTNYNRVKAIMWYEDRVLGNIIQDYTITNNTNASAYYSQALSNDTFFTRARKFQISQKLQSYSTQQAVVYKANSAPSIPQSKIIIGLAVSLSVLLVL